MASSCGQACGAGICMACTPGRAAAACELQQRRLGFLCVLYTANACMPTWPNSSTACEIAVPTFVKNSPTCSSTWPAFSSADSDGGGIRTAFEPCRVPRRGDAASPLEASSPSFEAPQPMLVPPQPNKTAHPTQATAKPPRPTRRSPRGPTICNVVTFFRGANRARARCGCIEQSRRRAGQQPRNSRLYHMPTCTNSPIPRNYRH